MQDDKENVSLSRFDLKLDFLKFWGWKLPKMKYHNGRKKVNMAQRA